MKMIRPHICAVSIRSTTRAWKSIAKAGHVVWDYPVNEQYSHVFRTIQETGPVKNADQGFRKVLETEDGSFAFIHEASMVIFHVFS